MQRAHVRVSSHLPGVKTRYMPENYPQGPLLKYLETILSAVFKNVFYEKNSMF